MILPKSYSLKYDRTDDSVALAGKVKLPVKIASSAILEIDKKQKRLDDSSSKILCCSSSKNILRASYSHDKLPKEPVTFIECMTTPKGPLARVTRCSTKTKEGDKTNYCIHLESKLKKDSSHKIIQPVIDSKRMILDQKARISGERTLSERSISCRKSKPMTHRSPPDCELACPGKADLKIDILLFPKTKDSLSQITRKNGLDPSEILSSLKKSSKKYKRRICPASCCQPVRSVTKDVSSDFLHMKSLALDAKSPIEICATQKRFDDQRLQRLASEKMLRTEVVRIEPAKSDKASACQKSAFKYACLIPKKVSRDTLRLPSSQELLERYKEYIPDYQLEKYEACRSRRNGLQDECIPPLLRTILRQEEQRRMDKCSKRNVDQLDQSGMSKSMNQTEFLFYFG